MRKWANDPVEVVPHPAPEVACRPARPEEMATRTIGAVRDDAVRAGWTVEATYARGTSLLARGKPGKVVDSLALRCNRAGERVVLIWIDGGFSTGIAHTRDRALHRVTLTNGRHLLVSVPDSDGTRVTGDGTMAEIVSGFPGKPRNSAEPTHQRFDFASLADGQVHKVRVGTELPMKAAVVWPRAKRWAVKAGKVAQVEIQGEYAYVQFLDVPAAVAADPNNPFEAQAA